MSEMQGGVENKSLSVRQDEILACVCTVYVQSYVVCVKQQDKGREGGDSAVLCDWESE